MMNQNASLATREDVLAALPTRATRVSINGNHTALSKPDSDDSVRPVSHKVWAS